MQRHEDKRDHAEITHHFILVFQKVPVWCILVSERSVVCMHSQKEVQQATNEIIVALEDRQLAESSIDQYKQHYQELNAYCKHGELRSIDENTLLEFLRSQYDVHMTSLHVKGLDRVAGNHIRPFTVLNWYLMTGEINTRVRVRNPLFICPEGFCDSYEAFMEYLRQKDLASSTVRNYRETVQQFIRHMISIGVESSEMISPAGILSFLSAFKHFSTNSFSYLITGIRQYLSFLFCSGFLDEDLSETLPQVKKPRYAGIPHIWSKEELKAILNAVDRMSPTGKRDYAIMLLVIQTGFCAADIRRLKLKDIDWKGHKIRITTAKNGQELELPLLESTGWAIIDYLQNGRPKTDCDCVFTRHIAPYGPIGSTSGLDFALGRYIMKAGIKFKKGERHGLHTLRNSLAKNMLDAGAPLPVISQTLGHQNVNTTAIYLKIDIDGLRKCALDISEWEV